MTMFPCRGLRVVGVCVLVVALVSAQLTFSRDWSAGKRASPVAFDCSQFAQICRQFIVSTRQAAKRSMLRASMLGRIGRPDVGPRLRRTEYARTYWITDHVKDEPFEVLDIRWHDLRQSLTKEKFGKHHKAVRQELAVDYDDDK
ncbi:unnamed protein product, partial [Iphiclides podalirius]